MKKIYTLLAVFWLASMTVMASITVTGHITQATDGEPVIGASVMEKGTSNGTITDYDGNYTITVGDKAKLVVSYIGMKTQEITVTGPKHDIVLQEAAIAVEEVVVTAQGIVQEKKKMNFAVQNVTSDALTAGKQQNFVNSLQGQIAGVTVTNSSGSPNAGQQIIIRGISSINTSQSNEPLFVLDGMPISGGATAAADINPNDIANVTVLKGAAAAALYGQEGANGVIMITTKSAEVGKVQVNINGSWQMDTPANLLKQQSTYMPGSNGFFRDKTGGGWGPMLSEGQKTYNNLENFLTMGFYHKYDVSVTGGTEKFQAYASASWSKADGVVPNDYKQKLGALIKASYSPAKWVTINASANISNTRSRSTSGVQTAYGWPLTDDITYYQEASGMPHFRYYADGEGNKYASPISPLYGIYNDNGLSRAMRNVLNASVTFKPVKGLELTGRVSYDTKAVSTESYVVPRWDDATVTQTVPKPAEERNAANAAEWDAYEAYLNYLATGYLTDPYLTTKDLENMGTRNSYLGYASSSSSMSELLNAGFIVNYNLALPKDFSMNFMVGGDIKTSHSTSKAMTGYNFIIPGTYSMSNTTGGDNLAVSDRTSTMSQKRMFSYYWEVRGDYKGLASLSVTGRWDWSSALKTSPFFYPSVTAGLVFSELIPGLNQTKNNWFSYGKLRGNFAIVGKDTSPYAYDRAYKQFATYPDGGYGIDPTVAAASPELQPEMSSSWEIGADLRFFNNMTRLDIAYYSTRVDNQIVTVRVSPASGYILQRRNEGSLRNQGFEFTWDQDIIKSRNFDWSMALNLGLNRGKVVALPEDVLEITGVQYGTVFTSAYLGMSTTSLSGKDYERNEEGKVICDENGYPTISPIKNKYIGNREGLFSAGLRSNMSIYGVQFGFLFDGRVGGDVFNFTQQSLISSGQAAILENYRGRQVVFDGVVSDGNGGWVKNTKPITLDATTIINSFYNVSSNFIEDGSYLRLSYVTLGYDFAKLMPHQKVLKSLNLSFTANNLFTLTRYTGSDPLCNASTSAYGTGSAGIDYFPIPSLRSYNFTLNVKF